MGLRHLYLINPRHFPDPQTNAMAAGADDILGNAVVCASIDEALQGVVYTVGMTARLRDISIEVKTPREAMPLVVQEAQEQQVALLFGTEMSGLTNEETGRSQLLVNIPANPEFSSLNLAASVQVVAYELSVAAQSFAPNVAQMLPAKHEQVEGYFAHLEKTLFEIGFFTTQNPSRMMQRLRRLYTQGHDWRRMRSISCAVSLSVTTEYNARLKSRYKQEEEQ